MDARAKLFRQKAIERLMSPERLDEPMKVVKLQSWIALLSVGMISLALLGWSIVGRIPITVRGSGVLIRPRTIVALQSPNQGRLLELHVEAGQRVTEGQLVGRLDREVLRKQLEQERERLAEIHREKSNSDALNEARLALVLENIRQQRSNMERQIAELERLSEEDRVTRQASLERREEILRNQLSNAQEMQSELEDHLERQNLLEEEGIVILSSLLSARQQVMNGESRIMELNSSLEDLARSRLELEDAYTQRQQRIRELQTSLEDLATREAQVQQDEFVRVMGFERQIRDVERAIQNLEEQIATEGEILSPFTGVLHELSVTPGELVPVGGRLGTIELDTPQSGQVAGDMVAILFLPIGDGKLLEPDGRKVWITPDNVERARFGSMLGTVREVSPLPITPDEAASVVGSVEIAAQVLAEGPAIQVLATLNPDPETYSGYAWSSSSGPPLEFSSGTTLQARVVVEERAPITFLLPILREYTGVY